MLRQIMFSSINENSDSKVKSQEWISLGLIVINFSYSQPKKTLLNSMSPLLLFFELSFKFW